MAEEEAARAFLELQVDGRVSGAAAVSWVAGHPRFAALSRPARAKAWSVADSNDSGALDDAQFAIFVKELDDAATASDASTPVAAAAAAGLVVGGPPGAVVLGGLTACYQSLSRVGQSAFVGGLGGMLAAGPPGAVAGAVVGAGGQRVADESYLGDPRRWSQYARRLAAAGWAVERDTLCSREITPKNGLILGRPPSVSVGDTRPLYPRSLPPLSFGWRGVVRGSYC